MAESEMTVRLRHVDGYRFEIDFGDAGGTRLGTDESAPLGEGQGPSAGRILGGAVANCLMASLVFCMDKREGEVAGLEGEVEITLGRNEEKRMRIASIDVNLTADVAEDQLETFEKCARVFEQFCIVTESVKTGIPIHTTLTRRDA